MTAETPASPPTIALRGVHLGSGGSLVDVLIRDGVVAAIGDFDLTEAEQVLDGRGGTLLPGLRDRHVHMVQWAIGQQRTDLAAATSARHAAELMAGLNSEAEVLWGKNFRDGLWPDAPHKELLDTALPGRAVALVSNDLHASWLSSTALELIGVEHRTGLLRESESFDAIRRLPQPGPELVDRWVVDAARTAASRGVTGILDFEFSDLVVDWTRRRRLGPLPIRVEASIFRPLLDAAITAGRRTGDVVDGTDGLLTVGPCKVLLDGSLNTRTAYCHQAYPGVNTRGLLTGDPTELAATISRAAAAGISFAVHAIGDAANRLALDVFATAGAPGRIEHAQLIDVTDLARFGQLGVIASVQPGHAPEDRDVADVHWRGRTERAFPYGALLAAGATLELGSDAPVSLLDPWHAMASAVFRTVDDRPAWHPEQAITVQQALAAATGGRTVPELGMPADLVLTGLDPATAGRAELAAMPVLLTVLAGRITHLALG